MTTLLTKMYNETQKSNLLQQHAAVITKNSKKIIVSTHNISRSKYVLLHSKAVLTCSFHAETAALHELLKRVLKTSKKKLCAL